MLQIRANETFYLKTKKDYEARTHFNFWHIICHLKSTCKTPGFITSWWESWNEKLNCRYDQYKIYSIKWHYIDISNSVFMLKKEQMRHFIWKQRKTVRQEPTLSFGTSFVNLNQHVKPRFITSWWGSWNEKLNCRCDTYKSYSLKWHSIDMSNSFFISWNKHMRDSDVWEIKK